MIKGAKLLLQRNIEKLGEWRKRNIEKKLMKKIVCCFQMTDFGSLQCEINYIQALAVKAYYENKLKYEGYERIYTALGAMRHAMQQHARKNRIAGGTLMIR